MFVSKKPISTVLCICLVVLISICTAKKANSSESFNQQKMTTHVLKLLSFDNKKTEYFKKWDEYLYKRNKFYNNEYQMAIKQLKDRFDITYAGLNSCISNVDQQCKNDSLSWIADLKVKFGSEYVAKNIDSMRFIILALVISDNLGPCKSQIKDTLYEEYRYFDAVNNYVKEFIEFSRTLSADDKKLLFEKVSAAEKYIKEFYYPFQGLWSHDGLREALFSVALKSREDLDPAVIEYISNHPGFKKQCLPGEAMKALNAITSE